MVYPKKSRGFCEADSTTSGQMPAPRKGVMAMQEYEFTLVLSGIQELSDDVLDSFYEAGCDDGLVGMRDGIAYVDFARRANSFQDAVLTAIRDVEKTGAQVQHIEPDEMVTMSEIARRLNVTREGVRKWIGGLRGPGNFPAPIGNLKNRSAIWRWTDVLQWKRKVEGKEGVSCAARNHPAGCTCGWGIAVINSVLELRRRGINIRIQDALLQTKGQEKQKK